MKRIDVVINKDVKQFITKERKGRSFQYTDTRTKIINGIPHILPVGVDQNQVYIICPYCGEFHIHGSCDNKDYQGCRVSHCLDIDNRKNYYIEKI